MNSLLEENEKLKTERDNLLMRVEFLEEELGFTPFPRYPWHFSQTEHRLFGALMKRDFISSRGLAACLNFKVEGHVDELKIIQVYIWKIRKILAPYGVTIENLRGQGYYMLKASKDLAREIITLSGSSAP